MSAYCVRPRYKRTNTFLTRMHSSRMRTAVAVMGGLHTPLEQAPPGCGPGDPPARSTSTSPLGVGLETPQPDPPQLPPWVWAWRPPLARSPSTSPLGVGLETCKACWDTPPPTGDLLQGMLGYHLQCMLG